MVVDTLAAAFIAVEENLEQLRGPEGPEGKAGLDGSHGLDGKPGLDGHDGPPGKAGVDGEPGAPGRDGADGSDGEGISWRGPWTAGSYDAQDAVEFEGSSYIARARTRAKPPGGQWDLMAKRGKDGTGVFRSGGGGPGGSSSGGSGLPAGGVARQALVKASGVDGDAEWSLQFTGQDAGANIGASMLVGDADGGNNTGGKIQFFGGNSASGSVGAEFVVSGASDDSARGGVFIGSGGDGSPGNAGGYGEIRGGTGSFSADEASIQAGGGSADALTAGYVRFKAGGAPDAINHVFYIMGGTVDPSAGAGVPANLASEFHRDVVGDGSGAGEIWFKTGPADTDWTKPGGGSLTQTRISQTPTCSTSPAYSIGDAVGGLLTFANAAASSGGSGTINVATVMSKTQALLPSLELVLFNQTFSASTDNAIFAPSDGDMANCLGSIPVTNWSDFSVNSIATRFGLGMGFILTGTDLFGQLVTRTAFTLAGTTDLVVSLTVAQD